MSFELCLCEQTLLREIADHTLTRDDIAATYALAMISTEGDQVDWRTVNLCIAERWSPLGLTYIKQRAWKILEGAT